MYTIIVVKNYEYELLSITEVTELKEYLLELDDPNAIVVMRHANDRGETYYTDLRNLMLELSPTELPETISDLSEMLTDIQFDGYRVPNPIKAYGNKIVSYTIQEIKGFTVRAVDIAVPYTREVLYEGQDKYSDLVFTPKSDEYSVDNLVFIKNGRYVKSTIFEGELYVPGGAINLTASDHVILDLGQIGGTAFYPMSELNVTSYDAGYTTVKLTGANYFTSVPWIVIEGILYDLPNPHIKVVDPQTIKINHDFPHIDIPGRRAEATDVSDEDYPAYMINEALTSDNSTLLVPYNKVYVLKHRLTKIDDVTYTYKSYDPHISGILMVAWQNMIVPMKLVTSQAHPITGMYNHIIKIAKPKTSLAMDEVMLNPDKRYTLNEPYNPDSRLDLRLIVVTT